MTKTSSQKNIFLRMSAILNVALAALLFLQPSAEAFLNSFQPNLIPVSSTAGVISPSDEMGSVSDKPLLQSALLPITEKTNAEPLDFSQSRSAVSISTYQNRYRQFARFVFASSQVDGSRKYQAYELNGQGVLGRLIETGLLLNGKFIRERIYDYKNGTVVLYNPKNVFEKRIYELREFGEAGRPVQYRGRTHSGDLVNIRFFYQPGKVVCVHMKSMTFSVYEFSNGLLGNLLEVGTARSVSLTGKIETSHRIAISEISRKGVSIPVYVFHELNGAQITRERIGGNAGAMEAMGRVHRFVSPGTDLEYFYSESLEGRVAKVRVLNHLLGESLTFEVKGTDLKEESGRLNSKKDAQRVPLIKAVFNSLPLFFKDSAGMFGMIPSVAKSLPIYIRLNDEVLIWEKLLRGPPAFNRTQFNLSSSTIFSFSSFLPLFSFFSFIVPAGGQV